MTDQEQQEEAIKKMREHQEEFMRQVHKQQLEQHAANLREQILHRERMMWAERTQREMNEVPRQQYACIVAVDERGAFSKDGEIPWRYKEDFKWFQEKTKGHICVMGRTTYDDINTRLGEKAKDSVLPDRKCFVVTSSALPVANATAVKSIGEIDKLLTEEDVSKTVFFCGGERIYSEAIAKCQQLLITVVNKDVEGDRHFPTAYTLKHFTMSQVYKNEGAPELRFTVWKRK